MHRRHFIHAAAASSVFAPYIIAQDKGKVYRTAIIGSGWWGMNLLREGLATKRAQCVAVCDVDERSRVASADEIEGLAGNKPKSYADYREMLEKEKPEIVVIATPDHWHALTTIAAVQAGAHVLVEKPTSHTINESKAMLAAARAADRVVQVGLHRRVGPHHVAAHEFLMSGKAGEIGAVQCFVIGGNGKPEAPSKNSEPPKGMDWDMWCGPAPLRPFNSKLHPGGWRNYLDYGNGQLGDWGVHWIDQAMWWSEEKWPKRVFSTGSRAIYGPAVLNDQEQTSDAPDSQLAVFEFEKFTLTWENRRYGGNEAEKSKIGIYYQGTKGTLHVGWKDGWTFYPANGKDPVQHGDSQLQEPDGHNLAILWADFIKAIDTKTRPSADIEIGHRSSVLPMLGMISLKTGRSLEWDGKTESILNDAAAQAMMARDYRGDWQYPTV
jgi:predicted dehydrogenase